MLLQTPLHDWHLKHNAKLVDFANWEMPLNYESIIEEHSTVRTRAGLFDVSHMGRIRIKGPDRVAFAQHLTTNDIESLPEYRVQYSFLCNPQGGIIDDITVYKAEEYIIIVCNASNREKVLNWLNSHKGKYSIIIGDETFSLSMLSFQGPIAELVLQGITMASLSEIKFYHFAVGLIKGVKVLISRTGYTGEDGFEIYLGMLYANAIWERILEAGRARGVKPIGLGARDTLRVEACLPLYGNEIDEYTTPLEIGFGKFVKFEKDDFIGKKALLHSTSSEFTRSLIAFEMLGNGIPRKGYEILFDGVPIGNVCSGIYSPTFRKGVGLGFVDEYKAKIGTPIQVRHSERIYDAVIRQRPLYKRRKY